MHYFKRNIGDYAKKAGRLSMLQHGAYTLLIDSCYDREEFPTMEQAIDWTWSSSKDEIEAVEFVLKKFFILNGDGTYTQKRIQEDLDKYHQTAETNKRIAADREERRRLAKEEKEKKENEAATKRERSVNEASEGGNESQGDANEATPNQEPLTTNQEPSKEIGKIKKRFVPPSLEEVQSYVFVNNYNVDPASFLAHYNSNDWKVGRNKMKCWKSSCVSWSLRESKNNNGRQFKTAAEKTAERLRDSRDPIKAMDF